MTKKGKSIIAIGYLFLCFSVILVFNHSRADSSLSFNEMKRLAEQGDPEAQYQLGALYYYGERVSRVKGIHYNGKPVQKDLEEAAKWFEKAANQNHVYAQFLLGSICEWRESQQDYFGSYQESIKWYKKAANQGHQPSKDRLTHIMRLVKKQGPFVKLKQVKGGPFYGLPGDKFLDAIYRNDEEEIKKLDSLYSPSYLSLLEFAAHKYMHEYRHNWLSCCLPSNDKNLIRRTFSYTVKEKKYVNLYGMNMGSVPGYTSSTYYVVPREFSFLLSMLGHNMGISVMRMAAGYHHWKEALNILEGVHQFQRKHRCNSPEVKQFEKNLISLTTSYFKKKNPGYIQPFDKNSNSRKTSQSIVPKPKFVGSWVTIVENQRIEMVLWDKPHKKYQFYGIVYAPNHDCIMTAHLGKDKGQWRLDFGCREASDRKNNCTLNIKGLNKNNFKGFGTAAIDTATDELTFKSDFFLLGKFLAGNVITAPDGKKIKTRVDLRFKRKAISNKLFEILKSYKLSGGNPDQNFLDEIKNG